jgi:cellulose synthase/poly-beta-1,6-N-acetylglucosamine synthase-like glycosyltransferase
MAVVSLAVVFGLVGFGIWGWSPGKATGDGAGGTARAASLDVTWLGIVMMSVVVYYFGLLALSITAERMLPDRDDFFMMVVVPAHNEELVIEKTLQSLVRLDYPSFLVLVMNDGSVDETSSIARTFEHTGRVAVFDRSAAVAGRGKGAVLNHAFEIVNDMVGSRDDRLAGHTADQIVIAIMDADGQLDKEALARVAPCFADPQVGAVQIGVRIVNARDGLIPRLQDLEFIGFSFYVQAARDRIGSVGLGGNGQFNRLSALRSLGRPPWTDCLTEDLDIGLALAEQGWRIRFRRGTFVAQQGLRSPRLLLRQRTRWVQGNYQCMAHIPKLLRSRKASLATRLDLCVYLLMVGFVMLVFAATALSVTDWVGALSVSNDALSFIPAGVPRNVAFETMATGPIWAFIFTYQRNSKFPLRWWEIPAYGVFFCGYSYFGVLFTIRAWTRMLLRRGTWAKTPRLLAESAD